MSKILDALKEKIDDLVTIESATLKQHDDQSVDVVGYCRTEMEGDQVAFLTSVDSELTELHIQVASEAQKSRAIMLNLITETIKQL